MSMDFLIAVLASLLVHMTLAVTHAPTPTNFVVFYHPTPTPTEYPTSTTTSAPTYGPSSTSIVQAIMGGVLGGTLFLIITYFLFGYYLYVSDMEKYEQQMDEKEKRDEIARRRLEAPKGKYFENDALIRSPQIDIEEDEGAGQSNPDLESRPLLEQGWSDTTRA